MASGIQNHKEFVDLCKEFKYDDHEYFSGAMDHSQRTPSQYIGGEYRAWAESPSTQITLAFESCPWSSDDVHTFYVMNQLIGSATAFSSGGPGKGMHCRAITSMMQRNNFVDSASGINSHFSDSGLFGIQLEGPGSHSQELMGVLVEEMANLRNPIDDVELNRSKNVLKMNVLMAMERQEDRLEEIARNIMTYGDLTFH